MTAGPAAIDRLDWADIALQLDREGYALLPGLLDPPAVRALRRLLDGPGGILTAPRADERVGRVDFFHVGDALPVPPMAWRESLYRHLAPIANLWCERLGMSYRYPSQLGAFLERNRGAGQCRPLSCLIRMVEHDYLALDQRAEGEHLFPLQMVALLSKPDEEFTGGEFIMTEQRPRMQSRPMVLPLRCGDAALIATAHRPVQGGKAYYRVSMKQAIGRITEGERIGLEMFFHDAR